MREMVSYQEIQQKRIKKKVGIPIKRIPTFYDYPYDCLCVAVEPNFSTNHEEDNRISLLLHDSTRKR